MSYYNSSLCSSMTTFVVGILSNCSTCKSSDCGFCTPVTPTTTTGELDKVMFHIHAMKEPDYVMSLMSTYGTSQRMGEDQKWFTSTEGVVVIKYPEVVVNHFQFWDAVDGHTSARMDLIALEETWETTRWPLQVFQFLLAITEVNVCQVQEYMFTEPEKRGENKCSQQEFWKEFAYSLIFNTKLEEESMSPRSLRKRRHNTDNNHHELIPLQPFRNFWGSQIIKTKTRCTQ